jgi:hypothetical protein
MPNKKYLKLFFHLISLMAVKSITLDVELINNTDLSDVKPFIEWNVKNAQYFDLDAGKEHYKLIAYIAQQLSSGFFWT